ncbi:Cysteine-rich secretory protein family protein [Flavobacterium cutihirudinis]|uniref:Cysteine-rich secretory protein family protein n=1 Tax=Flavobacterium cutihirudinis TaxID=1265740 RepID=A0A3D9FSG5_9FLAO|nr:CAP domain-containing protein [Flavobacterium cutihirudinis]RED22720.1 Cysteine-rich secretory protein family protein [Flavobacterium cutihirudinis]
MKIFRRSYLFVILGLLFCCCDSEDANHEDANYKEEISHEFVYNNDEIQTMKVINDYRISIGLKPLNKIDHVSEKASEHNNDMILKDNVGHEDFVNRSESIIKVLGAKNVAENIAYNYRSAEGALNSWLQSPSHRAIIEGDFTDFGISVMENPANGKKYYTNIFVKF